MITEEQAKEVANKLNVNFDLFPIEDFITGLNI